MKGMGSGEYLTRSEMWRDTVENRFEVVTFCPAFDAQYFSRDFNIVFFCDEDSLVRKRKRQADIQLVIRRDYCRLYLHETPFCCKMTKLFDHTRDRYVLQGGAIFRTTQEHDGSPIRTLKYSRLRGLDIERKGGVFKNGQRICAPKDGKCNDESKLAYDVHLNSLMCLKNCIYLNIYIIFVKQYP